MGISDAVIAGPCCRFWLTPRLVSRLLHHSTRCASRPATGSSDHACLLFPSFSCSDKEKKKSRAAGLSWRRAGCAAVSVPFLPKSGATVADVQNSITRLQHLFIPITQCLPPVRPRGWATSLKTLLAASMWHAAQTGRSAKFANAVCVPLIAPPFAFRMFS
jgi:hypothetical protein